MSAFRLLTWNVAGRVRDRQEQQLLALDELPADVVCLQEVTPTTRERWVAALAERGLHVAVSPFPPQASGSRRLATLIAAAAPVEILDVHGLPWPERHLAVRTVLGGATVEVHTLHAPLSQKAELVKVRTLERIYEVLAPPAGTPRVIAGDFNTPSYESREGEIQTFARTRTGRIRPQYGERHDLAELALIAGLPQLGWSDAFRSLHGYLRRDRSWKAGRWPGWRLDHIIASPALRVVACDYVHAWREQGLSDHSAMWADLEVRDPG